MTAGRPAAGTPLTGKRNPLRVPVVASKPTRVTDELISLAEDLLARRIAKGDVKRLLTARYLKDNPKGRISPRSLETVISAARAAILAGTGRDREEHRAESLALYQAVIRAPGTSAKDRLRAQECIDRLLGLSAPLRHEVTGKDGAALPVANLAVLTDADLSILESIAARAADRPPPVGLGGDPGGAGPAEPA